MISDQLGVKNHEKKWAIKPVTQDSDVEMEELFGDDHGGDLDSEEELSDHLNSPTLELPGRGDEVDANESKDPAEPKSLKAAGADDMRGAYWDFIHQEQKKLKKESPEMSGREILKLARERYLCCNKIW